MCCSGRAWGLLGRVRFGSFCGGLVCFGSVGRVCLARGSASASPFAWV